MSNYNVTSDKIHRVLTFLIGAASPRSRKAMSVLGFDQDELDAGWGLLRRAAGDRMDVSAGPQAEDPKLVAAIDAFEDEWFPVVAATLERRYPALHAMVFLNLTQANGIGAAVTVRTLLDRVAQMQGAEAQAAKDLLAKRGFGAEAVAQGNALLAKLATLAPVPAEDPEQDRADRQAAESELWAWYIEWSTIVQAKVKNGQVLQKLGYLRGGRKAGGDTDQEGGGVPVGPA